LSCFATWTRIPAARAGSPAALVVLASTTAVHGADGDVVVFENVVDRHRGAGPVGSEAVGLEDHDVDAGGGAVSTAITRQKPSTANLATS
jgi:hypothetical protein